MAEEAKEEESDTSSSIITISELIDNAFGDPNMNTVHHKHIQTVLYILARQLRILQRRVSVRLTPYQIQAQKSSSGLSVTEVKMQAMTESKEKLVMEKWKSSVKASRIREKDGKEAEKRGNEGLSKKYTSASDETSSAKTSSQKVLSIGLSSEKTSIGKKSTVAEDELVVDKSSSAGKKSVAGKSSTTDKLSIEADISDNILTADQSSNTEKISTSDKILKAAEKSISNKSSTTGEALLDYNMSDDDAAVTSGKISKTGKVTTVSKISATGKSSTAGKTYHDDDVSDGDITTTIDKISKHVKKENAGKTGIASKTSTAGKNTTDKLPSTGISLSKSSSDRTVSADRRPKLTQGRSATKPAEYTSIKPQDYQRILDEVEEMRERELRVIRQRVDSREEPEKTPTPLASMDSFEATYEKLLVVERVPPEEAQARAARERPVAPRVSVVTKEQFQELAAKVHDIQKKLAPIGTPDFPENAELMKELRKGASLTDAMAALQLSARLEATEKTLKNMLSFVTDLANQTPGFRPTDDIEVLFGTSHGTGKSAPKSAKSKSQKEIYLPEINISPIDSDEILMPSTSLRTSATSADDIQKLDDVITFSRLGEALQDVYDDVMKQVTDKTTQSTVNAENALKMVISLEKKIESSINLGNKMEALESLVAKYSEQINILDTGLSSQLTNFQEELTQMQHDLETGLENMAEVLANSGGDAAAVSELNAHFNDLQANIDDAVQRQKELRYIQSVFTTDLDGLRLQIEMLRDTKSDRDEVVDALRDKAGLGDLNGLVSHEQFDAVRGDIEIRISLAYDKFNNQEAVWQKAIDDLLRELSEKADIIQVESLRDEINRYLEILRAKLKILTDIVGEPAAAAISRKLARDAACLSCAAPAHMKTEENTTPVLPAMRPPTIGAEAPKPAEDDDHGLCYQGYPVKHPIDPRGHICNRWCGGSHTIINKEQKTRIPPSVTVTSLNRLVGQERRTDGKMYAVDEMVPKKPCAQCIIPVPPPVVPQTSNNDIIRIEDPPSFDYRPISAVPEYDVTPPL